jgi:hypothetical protein
LNCFCVFFQKIQEPGKPGKNREMAGKNREISWVGAPSFFFKKITGAHPAAKRLGTPRYLNLGISASLLAGAPCNAEEVRKIA